MVGIDEDLSAARNATESGVTSTVAKRPTTIIVEEVRTGGSENVEVQPTIVVIVGENAGVRTRDITDSSLVGDLRERDTLILE